MQRVILMRRLEQRLVMLLRGVGVLAVLMSILVGLSGSALAAPDHGPKVYLLRGFLNVFSLGLDELSAKIAARGIRAEVYNHTSWSRLAEEITREYKSGQTRPVILIGHSAGGAAVVSLVEALGKAGVPVALAVSLDAAPATITAGRVGTFLNLYVSTGALTPTRGFHGRIINTDLAKQMQVAHLTIDKIEPVHNMILRQLAQVVPTGHRRAPAHANVAGVAATSTAR